MDSDIQISDKDFFKYFGILVLLGAITYGIITYVKYSNKQETIEQTTTFFNQYTDDEYIAFAKKLEASINDLEPKLLNKSVNLKSFFDFSNKDIQDSHKKRAMLSFMESRLKIGDQLVETIDNYGEFKFLKFYKKDGVPHIIFRIYGDLSLNFMDFELGINDQSIVLNDSFNYSLGTKSSAFLSEQYYKIANPTNQIRKTASIYEETMSSFLSNNYEHAYNILEQVPQSERNAIYYQFRNRAASHLNRDMYIASVNDCLEKQSASKRFHAYLNYQKSVVIGAVEDSEKFVEVLKEFTGKDPIFIFYKGLAYQNNNEFGKAIPFFNKTIEEIPHLKDPYSQKIYCLLELEKEEDALKALAVLHEKFTVSYADVTNYLIKYQDFINSEDYKSIFKIESNVN